jgi:molecular chaperone GrpE
MNTDTHNDGEQFADDAKANDQRSQQDREAVNDSVDEAPEPGYSENDQTDSDGIEHDDDAEQHVSKLRSQLKTCRSEKQDYLDQLQRLQADYINVKKQLDSERASARSKARVDVLESLLPALDSFEMAFADTERWQAIDKNWRIGVENIYAQLVDALASNGIVQIAPAEQTPFNPNQHESVETIATADTASDNTIARVLQTGYVSDDAVIRPAKVQVYQRRDTERERHSSDDTEL